MNERGPDKKKKGKSEKLTLKDLGSALGMSEALNSIPNRTQTLSAALNPSEEPDASQPDLFPEAGNERVEDAIHTFFDVTESGGCISNVYEEISKTLTSDELAEFKKCAKERADERDLDISFPDDVPTEVQNEEAPEWKALQDGNPTGDGRIGGRPYWRADDGAVYIGLSEGIPRRFAHGEGFTYRANGGNERIIQYWDKEKNAFTDEDPTPEIKEERERLKNGAIITKLPENREYAPEKLAQIQASMLEDVAKLELSDELKTKFAEAIAAIRVRKDARAVRKLINSRQEKAQKSKPPRASEQTVPQKKVDAPNLIPGAQVVDGKLVGVREGKAVRLPNKEEEQLFAAQKALEKQASVDEAVPYTQQELENAQNKLRERLSALNLDAKQAAAFELGIAEADSEQMIRALVHQIGDIETASLSTRLSARPQNLSTSDVLGLPKIKQSAPDANPTVAPISPTSPGGRGPGGRIPNGPAAPSEREWNDPHLIYGSGERGHRRPTSWEVDPKNYIGVNIKPIRQILATPKDAQFFGEILRAIDSTKGDVLLRLKDGTATQDDMDFLTYGTYEYAKWMQAGEKVAAQVTQEDVELMARRNSDMQNMVAFVGEDRGLETMKNLVLHLAMKNPAQMQELVESFENLKRARESFRFKRAESRIKAQSERVGIAKKDYGAMFDLKNPRSRRETELRLAAHIHEEAGGFRRALDWVGKVTKTTIPGSSRYKAILETMEAGRITPNQRSILSPTSWVQDTVITELDTITEYLAATVADPEVRRAIVLESISNESQKLASEGGPSSYADVKKLASEKLSQGSLRETIQKRIEGIPDFASKSANEQDSILSDIKSSESAKQGKGKGFFAWLASALFGTEFDKAAGQVVGRPVHA